MKYQPLGQILINKNVIAKKSLDFCLAVQKADPAARKIGHYIVYYNFARERDIAEALSETRIFQWNLYSKHGFCKQINNGFHY